MAYLELRVDAGPARVPDGADSFLIEDGKIQAQTIHYTVVDADGRVPSTRTGPLPALRTGWRKHRWAADRAALRRGGRG